MKIWRWLIEIVLLVILLVGGCFEKPSDPSGVTVASRVQDVLSDTADDLELGAKVRDIVEKQQLGKPCVHQRELAAQAKYRPLYPVNSIIFGMTFIIWVAILLDIIKGKPDAKNT